MPRFRSKPRQITAEQYHRGQPLPMGVCLCARQVMGPHVHTMHRGQLVELQDGDWVVPEPDEVHYYPIKDDVLKANYELLEEDNFNANT